MNKYTFIKFTTPAQYAAAVIGIAAEYLFFLAIFILCI